MSDAGYSLAVRPPLKLWRVPVSWKGGECIVSVPARSQDEARARAVRVHAATCGRALVFGVPFLPAEAGQVEGRAE